MRKGSLYTATRVRVDSCLGRPTILRDCPRYCIPKLISFHTYWFLNIFSIDILYTNMPIAPAMILIEMKPFNEVLHLLPKISMFVS